MYLCVCACVCVQVFSACVLCAFSLASLQCVPLFHSQGLSVAEVISGYEMALKKALEILPGELLDHFLIIQCVYHSCDINCMYIT